MPRRKSPTLTDAEQRIMEVLWKAGSATVAGVAEALRGTEGSAYTTLLTMMGILKDKGYLTCRKRGRAHVFKPRVSRRTAARNAARKLLGAFFNDSPGQLVLNFLRYEDLSPKELDDLKRMIAESKDEPAKTP